MIKVCKVCGQEKEHKSWKANTCNECLEAGLKWCSECQTVQHIENFHLCRGKPIGRCKQCEIKISHRKKVDSGYFSRPEVVAARNKSSRECHAKKLADPVRRQEVYDRHNERLRERYATDEAYRLKRIEDINIRKGREIGHVSSDDWSRCMQHFNSSCAYCGADTKLTRDHVKPVIHGGLNESVNVVPACLSCNTSKRDKDMLTWYTTQSFFSEERLNQILIWIGGDVNA